ncbi:hypothetical protein [Polaribacter sp.]|uniref:hypothetical protein n=1 Tax=Polaribacter sp. TaxID=1920175 RepID=UPI003EF64881
MTNIIGKFYHKKSPIATSNLGWNAQKLIFVVREPFLSKLSQITIGHGSITKNNTLKIESNMPTKGIIFSDGIEADF